MATTDHFISIAKRQVPLGDLMTSGITVGTSTSATAYLEFRWQEDTAADAAHPTGITRKDCINFLELMARFLKAGGLTQNGTGTPAT